MTDGRQAATPDGQTDKEPELTEAQVRARIALLDARAAHLRQQMLATVVESLLLERRLHHPPPSPLPQPVKEHTEAKKLRSAHQRARDRAGEDADQWVATAIDRRNASSRAHSRRDPQRGVGEDDKAAMVTSAQEMLRQTLARPTDGIGPIHGPPKPPAEAPSAARQRDTKDAQRRQERARKAADDPRVAQAQALLLRILDGGSVPDQGL